MCSLNRYFDFVNSHKNVSISPTTQVVLDKFIFNVIRHNLNIVQNKLKIYYQNVRGLRFKIFHFRSNLILIQYDVFVFTET